LDEEMNEQAIQKAIDNYIAMEQDAKIMDLIRKDVITGIERWDNGQWRVFTRTGFAVGDTPHDAVQQLLNVL
jgi:hypothetical protein